MNNTTTFTAKAPTFHQRLIRAMESMRNPSKEVLKRLAETRDAGRAKGWND